MIATVDQATVYKMLHKAFQARKKTKLFHSRYIKLTVDKDKADGHISLQTSDNENTFLCQIEASNCSSGQAIVDCEILLRIIRVASGKVNMKTIEVEGTKGCSLEIISDGCTYLLSTIDDDNEFFELPDFGKELVSFDIPGKTIRELISRVFYASSTDSTRFTLESVLFDFKKDNLILVGTDGHRMAILTKEIKTSLIKTDNAHFPTPRRWLTALMQIVKICDESVHIEFTASHAILKCNNVSLFARLISGTYPAYRNIVPEETKTLISFDRAAFIRAIKKIRAVPTVSGMHGTAIRMSPSNIHLSIGKIDYGCTAEIASPVLNFDGEEIEFGMNIVYFQEALNKCTSDTVSLGLNDKLGPMHLTEIKDKETDEIYEAVLMPMRI